MPFYVLSLILKISKLEIDLIVVGSTFQSLGAAQQNDLSAKVFLVLIFGKVNKAAQSSLRLKLYLDGGKTDIKWRKSSGAIPCSTLSVRRIIAI